MANNTLEMNRIHHKLLTDIKDNMVVDSPEYENFTEHLKSYVPKGRLDGKSMLAQLETLSKFGYLKLGDYKVLKNVCVDSGNINIVEMIEDAERKIKEVAERKIKEVKQDNSRGKCQDNSVPEKKPRLDFTGVKNDLIKKYRKHYIKTELFPWRPFKQEVEVDAVYSPLYMERQVNKSIKGKGEKSNKEVQSTSGEVQSTSGNTVEVMKYMKTEYIPVKPLKERDEIYALYSPNFEKGPLKKSHREPFKFVRNTNVPREVYYEHIGKVRKQAKKPVSAIHELFYYNNKCYKQILVSAKSGAGKTTLCRKLISLWCEQSRVGPETETETKQKKAFLYVNDEDRTSKDEKIEETVKFDFLFYVSLRHAKLEENIEDMIVEQLKIKEEDLEQILESTKCLVIVDGLDEWTPRPKIDYGPIDLKGCPKEKKFDRLFTLFTTRPWKLVEEAKAAHKIELQCHLKGLDTYEEMVKLYAPFIEVHNVLPLDSTRIEFSVGTFLEKAGEKACMYSSPLLLKLVMLQWAECDDLGKSICRLYGRTINLLIKSGLERNENDEQFMSEVKNLTKHKDEVPVCFKEFLYLIQCMSVIKQVAKMSFSLLLKGTLVLTDAEFNRYVAEESKDLNFLKKLGLFSESLHNCESEESKVSFIHKSFQEFFAAVYIVSNPGECYEILEAKWFEKDPDKYYNAKAVVLSDVLRFVSGMDQNAMPKMYELIFMFTFDDLSVDKQIGCNLPYDTDSQFFTCFKKKYGGIFKLQPFHKCTCTFLHCRCLDTSIIGDYSLDEFFNNYYGYVIANIKEVKNSGQESFRLINIPYFYLHFIVGLGNVLNSEMNKMIDYIDYVNPLSIKSLAICTELNEEYIEFYRDEKSTTSCISTLFFWPGKCSNLKEINLKCESLTTMQLENLLLHKPSTLETIVLDKVRWQCGSIHEQFRSYSFSKLRELSLNSIDGVLTHKQITCMLIDSSCLQSVFFVDVYCKEDMYCGCKEGSTNKFFSSSVKHLRIVNSLGVVCHVYSYPNLEKLSLTDSYFRGPRITSKSFGHLTCCCSHQDVNVTDRLHSTSLNEEKSMIWDCCSKHNLLKMYNACDFNSLDRLRALKDIYLDRIETGHSNITYLLKLPHLESVCFYNVVCEADSMCGCLTVPETLLPPANNTKSYAECTIQKLTLIGGAEIFTHISGMTKLKDLFFEGEVHEIESVFLTAPHLENVVFQKRQYEYEPLVLEKPYDIFYLKMCKVSQKQLLDFLENLSKNDRSLQVKLDKVQLIDGDADDVFETVSDLKNIKVKECRKFNLKEFLTWKNFDKGLCEVSFPDFPLVSMIVEKKV